MVRSLAQLSEEVAALAGRDSYGVYVLDDLAQMRIGVNATPEEVRRQGRDVVEWLRDEGLYGLAEEVGDAVTLKASREHQAKRSQYEQLSGGRQANNWDFEGWL